MPEIEIALKNSKVKSYHRFAWILAFLIAAVEIVLTFSDKYKEDRFYPIFTTAMLLFLLVVGRGDKYNYTRRKQYVEFGYVFLAAILVKWHIYWAAAVVILFSILYLISIRKFQVIISKDHIRYPSFPARTIHWHELDNLVMKDDLLTINFKNDKMIQAETEGEDFFNEQDFNDFCKAQLALAASRLP